jgi:hypothetical protein
MYIVGKYKDITSSTSFRNMKKSKSLVNFSFFPLFITNKWYKSGLNLFKNYFTSWLETKKQFQIGYKVYKV